MGRRKSSVARVRIKPGSGGFQVNKRDMKEFFPTHQHQSMVQAPLEATQTRESIDIHVNIRGGGLSGQAGAVVLGVARALMELDGSHEAVLREHGFLTRDGRMKERKKYGQKGARKKFQFSKR
ncbi:MAG: 30S ribosomal protein S9 [Planctomycetota bacterium]